MLLGIPQSWRVSSFLVLLFTLSCFRHQVAEANGQFQIQILAVENLRSDSPDGACCSQSAGQSVPSSAPSSPENSSKNRTLQISSQAASSQCSHICRPYLRICFKQFQRNVILTEDCILEGFSPVLALPISSDGVDQGNNSKTIAINLPFQFGWMKSYTVIMELLEAKGAKANRSVDRLLEQGVQSDEILPGPMWRKLVHNGNAARITYQLRVTCDEFYGNVTCLAYCKPRNDNFGHWYCNDQAKMVCLDGWTGPNCEKAICSSTCQNGTCLQPGECRCRPGWQGANCDKCVAHVACKHGTCSSKPWECICEQGWGGPMCDRDLNYCGRNSPCYNYAVCHNTGEGNFYECRCPQGFGGADCSEVVDPCESNTVCENAGQCFNNNGTGQCQCPPGWAGAKCDTDVDECNPNPCQSGATCMDEIAAYKCLCPVGFAGVNCGDDVRPKPPTAPEISRINYLHAMDRSANASETAESKEGDTKGHPEESSSKSVHDDSSTVVITVVLSIFLVLSVLCCVLMSLFFYRRRQKIRRSLEDSINSDKYGCGTSNNQQQTKDLLHRKDSELTVTRCNQDNEARLKILNNIFTPERKMSVDGGDNMSDKSDSSAESLRKMKADAFSPAELPPVRYVSEPADAQITGYDPYWNNRDRPTLYASKDLKNSYMESIRRAHVPEAARSPALLASPISCADAKRQLEDFTVV